MQLVKKFPGFLQEFRHAKDGAPVDKALVIRDADHKNPAELLAKMEARIVNRVYPFPRKLLIVVEELEAWLLADEEAFLAAYVRILKSQSWCRGYEYIDAFAGTGKPKSREEQRYVDGSPRVALSLTPPFTQYHFVEEESWRVAKLERLRAEFADRASPYIMAIATRSFENKSFRN